LQEVTHTHTPLLTRHTHTTPVNVRMPVLYAVTVLNARAHDEPQLGRHGASVGLSDELNISQCTRAPQQTTRDDDDIDDGGGGGAAAAAATVADVDTDDTRGCDSTKLLPDELMDKILSMLPSTTLRSGTLELVCSRWTRLMKRLVEKDDERYRKMCGSVHP
jgi:hypothetical protein